MLSIVRRGTAAGLAALAMTLATGSAFAAWDELNLPVGVTPISRDVYDLHMLMLWICVIIGIIVFGAMFVSIVLHRKAAGHAPAQFHHSTFAEILWTAVPFVILVGFAIPATRTLIDMEDTSESALTIKVTGYQWLWKYEYIEDGVSFYSSLAPSSRSAIYGDPWKVDNYLLEVDNAVVLPVGKKVRFLLTADDVIHAWWVPALGMKKDAIPGFVNEIWAVIEEPGTYRGQCAELCGKDHGFMPIVIEAKSPDEYKQWVAAYKAEQQTQLAATTTPSQ
jgi:cytochrome c oxidase subunit 2